MSKRKKTTRTKSQSELHAEAAERRREAHTRLVLGRQGDPRFVQQTRTEHGRTISWSDDSEMGSVLTSALEAQRQRFRDKFGRDPEPEDPIIFDPDSDEPTPFDPTGAFLAMTAVGEELGIDPAFFIAAEEVGYIVTEGNEHLFTLAEVEAYAAAVDRARQNDR